MEWSCDAGMSLSTFKLDDRRDILLDPDRVFWAIVDNAAEGAKATAEKTHSQVAEDLGERFRRFRFDTQLTALYVNPNDACHADCRYCYIPPEIRRSGARMSKEQLDSVLQKADRYFAKQEMGGRKPVIIFHGSEPLVVKDTVFSAIRENQDRFSFGLQTDGTLLTDEDVEFLKEMRVSVGISLDSYDPEVQYYLRRAPGGRAAFDRTVHAIEAFAGYPGLNVVTTITRHNVGQLSGLIDFLHDRKVRVALMNPVRGTQDYSREFQPDCDSLLAGFSAAVRRALELTESTAEPILVGDFSNLVLAIVAPEGRRLMCDITPCGGGRCFLAVTGSGEMVPCGEFQGLPGFSGGNIFRDSIEAALESAPFQRVRGRIVERIEECRVCALKHICGAPCPAEAQGMHGDMLTASPYCEFYKGIIKLAFELIAEGKTHLCLREGAVANLEVDYCLAQ